MRYATTVVLALLATVGPAVCAPLDSRAVPSDGPYNNSTGMATHQDDDTKDLPRREQLAQSVELLARDNPPPSVDIPPSPAHQGYSPYPVYPAHAPQPHIMVGAPGGHDFQLIPPEASYKKPVPQSVKDTWNGLHPAGKVAAGVVAALAAQDIFDHFKAKPEENFNNRNHPECIPQPGGQCLYSEYRRDDTAALL
ncbi:hypothetical protein BC835DRAFT_1423765 [Cytidiella melzeri]|nr:hypothetical protein BC835DRAFT_1423765 [Cytidiella melzeri]